MEPLTDAELGEIEATLTAVLARQGRLAVEPLGPAGAQTLLRLLAEVGRLRVENERLVHTTS